MAGILASTVGVRNPESTLSVVAMAEQPIRRNPEFGAAGYGKTPKEVRLGTYLSHACTRPGTGSRPGASRALEQAPDPVVLQSANLVLILHFTPQTAFSRFSAMFARSLELLRSMGWHAPCNSFTARTERGGEESRTILPEATTRRSASSLFPAFALTVSCLRQGSVGRQEFFGLLRCA